MTMERRPNFRMIRGSLLRPGLTVIKGDPSQNNLVKTPAGRYWELVNDARDRIAAADKPQDEEDIGRMDELRFEKLDEGDKEAYYKSLFPDNDASPRTSSPNNVSFFKIKKE